MNVRTQMAIRLFVVCWLRNIEVMRVQNRQMNANLHVIKYKAVLESGPIIIVTGSTSINTTTDWQMLLLACVQAGSIRNMRGQLPVMIEIMGNVELLSTPMAVGLKLVILIN